MQPRLDLRANMTRYTNTSLLTVRCCRVVRFGLRQLVDHLSALPLHITSINDEEAAPASNKALTPKSDSYSTLKSSSLFGPAGSRTSSAQHFISCDTEYEHKYLRIADLASLGSLPGSVQ